MAGSRSADPQFVRVAARPVPTNAAGYIGAWGAAVSGGLDNQEHAKLLRQLRIPPQRPLDERHLLWIVRQSLPSLISRLKRLLH